MRIFDAYAYQVVEEGGGDLAKLLTKQGLRGWHVVAVLSPGRVLMERKLEDEGWIVRGKADPVIINRDVLEGWVVSEAGGGAIYVDLDGEEKRCSFSTLLAAESAAELLANGDPLPAELFDD